MRRRELIIAYFSALSASTASQLLYSPFKRLRAEAAGLPPGLAFAQPLVASGPVRTRAHGQIIEGLDITAASDTAVRITHRNVVLKNCRIRHSKGCGVLATNAHGLMIADLEIECLATGGLNRSNNVHIEGSPATKIMRVKASGGSSNIYALDSSGLEASFLELHDAKGPMPRGQNVQLDKCPNSLVEDFSGENGPLSYTEDNISIFCSDSCIVRRGLAYYNNSPTGVGIMLEGSSNCLVEDVDAVEQGNGAFAAVPVGDAACGACTFRRCRTRGSYNSSRDGRERPSSNGLSICTRVSAGAPKHTITNCHYHALANPRNLIWDSLAVNDGWSFTERQFLSRGPLRLAFPW
jgi:hypothetical protein